MTMIADVSLLLRCLGHALNRSYWWLNCVGENLCVANEFSFVIRSIPHFGLLHLAPSRLDGKGIRRLCRHTHGPSELAWQGVMRFFCRHWFDWRRSKFHGLSSCAFATREVNDALQITRRLHQSVLYLTTALVYTFSIKKSCTHHAPSTSICLLPDDSIGIHFFHRKELHALPANDILYSHSALCTFLKI